MKQCPVACLAENRGISSSLRTRDIRPVLMYKQVGNLESIAVSLASPIKLGNRHTTSHALHGYDFLGPEYWTEFFNAVISLCDKRKIPRISRKAFCFLRERLSWFCLINKRRWPLNTPLLFGKWGVPMPSTRTIPQPGTQRDICLSEGSACQLSLKPKWISKLYTAPPHSPIILEKFTETKYSKLCFQRSIRHRITLAPL